MSGGGGEMSGSLLRVSVLQLFAIMCLRNWEMAAYFTLCLGLCVAVQDLVLSLAVLLDGPWSVNVEFTCHTHLLW